ncbi:MAG: hypothetical protein DRP08_01165 [Candidatus Aenigmatarchaeota archaeon]|nr:MAG: hypothetical protein DRP08_01165 [Candidatus Aenigmarchaeota archaeon]
MSKKTITLFEIKSILESLVNTFDKPVMTENDFRHIRSSLDSTISRIQQTEMTDFSVEYYMRSQQKQVRHFSTLKSAQEFMLFLSSAENCESYHLRR